ncbi:hypothetical protein FQR65_LT08927 [Abscondita terminalis]|nr:hypothetical protein FQR65_LT08927 [Abscondita terminalis]
MYKLVLICVLCIVRVSIADLEFKMENNELKLCVDDLIRNNFDQHKTLLYLKMNNDSTTLVGESNHPNVIFKLRQNVMFGRVVKYKPIVIMHLNMFTIDIIMQILLKSELLSIYNYYNSKYVIVTTTPNIHLIFAYFWKKGIVNLVIIAYSKMQHTYDINIYTSDPQAAGNQCGKKVAVIQKQKCNSKIRIQFPKLLRKFSYCNVLFFRRPEKNFSLSKLKSVDIVVDQLTQHLNASLTVSDDQIRMSKFFVIASVLNHFYPSKESSVIAYDDFVWTVPHRKNCNPSKFYKLFSKTACVYSVHIQTAFTSNLINILTLPQYEKPIGSLEELLNRNISIYVTMNYYTPYFNEDWPEDILYTKIQKKILLYGDKLFETFINDMNTYVNKSFFSTRDEVALLELRLKTRIYTIVDNRITTSRKITLKCERDSYFADTLLKLIDLFIEVGLHDHLIKNINFERNLYAVSSSARILEENIVLNLKHLTFPFVFWVVGVILAMFVFIVETVIMKKVKSAMPVFY